MVLYVATDCIHLLLVTVACHTYTHKMSNLVIPHLLTRIFKVCNPHLVTYTFTNNWWPQIVTTALTNNWRWMCDQSYLWLLFTILNIFIKYIFTNIFITYTFTNSWWPQIVTTALTNNWRWMCDQSYLWPQIVTSVPMTPPSLSSDVFILDPPRGNFNSVTNQYDIGSY